MQISCYRYNIKLAKGEILKKYLTCAFSRSKQARRTTPDGVFLGQEMVIQQGRENIQK